MIFILGAEGFVGSAFVRYCLKNKIEHAPIDLNNYQEFKGQRCDLLINAAGNSSKRLALTDPGQIFDRNVRDTLLSLIDFSVDRYVYLSTCDVYNDCSNPAYNVETTAILPVKLSRYGMSKYMGELLAQQYARTCIIVRMGGMVGPGLRKNAIYDLTHGGKLYVHPDSAYQYLHTDQVAQMVLRLAQEMPGGDVLNLCGDGVVELRLVQSWMGQPTLASDLPPERYEINITKLKALITVPTSAAAVRQYFQEIRGETESIEHAGS
jgi:nucleoside-diphosphate-sugar epimerase